MTKRALTILIATVLGIGGVTTALVATSGGEHGSATHVMSNGRTMDVLEMHKMSGDDWMADDEMHDWDTRH